MISTKEIQAPFHINGTRVPLSELPEISRRTEALVRECGFADYPELGDLEKNVQPLKEIDRLENGINAEIISVALIVAAFVAFTLILVLAPPPPHSAALCVLLCSWCVSAPGTAASAGTLERDCETLQRLKENPHLEGLQRKMQEYLEDAFSYYQTNGRVLEESLAYSLVAAEETNPGQFSLEDLIAAQKEIRKLSEFYDRFVRSESQIVTAANCPYVELVENPV